MYRKKLIEVALPLEAINEASAKEKSIRHGHPSTLHLWWARRPLAACRAVLFASLVDDPSSHPEEYPTEVEQENERKRLFGIIERLVIWENINNKTVLDEARAAIAKSTGDHPPSVYDPFCGGGSIPLEAQRLGLEACGSDLNPVAVLITKALVEIPPKFANRAPVNPEARKKGMRSGAYPGALGLSEDIRYYGEWMRTQAVRRIGHLYPSVRLPDGTDTTIIAWIWARTVRCPNPACQAEMPLVSTFVLCTKKGRETWVEPAVDHVSKTVRFRVRSGSGKPPVPPKTGRGANFRCLVCEQSASESHIKLEGQAKRMGSRLLATVAAGNNRRVYMDPDSEQEKIARSAQPQWEPDQELAYDPRNIWCTQYGLTRFGDLFTKRQLVALATFSDLVAEMHVQAISDGAEQEYAAALSTYLSLGVSRLVNRSSTICFWDQGGENVQQVFARQAIPMTWDYVESNPLSTSTGNFLGQLEYLRHVLEGTPASGRSEIKQVDATAISESGRLFCTDPPYYDNISYADLSDFFFVWLRRSLFSVYPQLFSTLLVPKAQELVATPYRFDKSKEKAQEFFETGFGKAMQCIRRDQNADFPLAIFYAFRQSENDSEEQEDSGATIASTGWETMLEGLMKADFEITGTWPIRTELVRNLKKRVGALASSIVLVCRPRSESASLTTRKDFLAALKRELGPAIRTLQAGNIAPVDLQQAAIGPGMAIFSRYKKVIESDGTRMRVRAALGLINQALDQVLSEQESDYDAETRWALTWFEQNQFNEGPFGDANVLASAKALSVEGLQSAGLLIARASKVQLLKREELSTNWDPSTDRHLIIWKVTQHLIYRLATQGQDATRDLAAKLGGMADVARELAYRLYTLCERKGWAEEAGYYNALVIAWPAIRSQEFTLTGEE